MNFPRPPPHILLAEDDPTSRLVTEEMLTSFGYTVTSVHNGRDALTLLGVIKPDLIFSDLRMPMGDGLELLQQVRVDPILHRIPFIIGSSKTDQSAIREAMSLGADDYILKPYVAEDVKKAIEVRLSIARQLTEEFAFHESFLSKSLPHEFRTPLNAIVGYADLMTLTAKEGLTLSSAELLEYGTLLNESAGRLLKLAENFIFWAHLESKRQQKKRPAPHATDNTRMVTPEEIREITRSVAAQYGRPDDVVFNLTETCVISVATHGFEFVLRHIIDNAFKYSAAGQRVHLSSEANGKMLHVTIVDFGRGMTLAQIGNIGLLHQFDRHIFEQQGLGMGLILAMNFARISGGSLQLRPTSSHSGLTALLSLPLSRLTEAMKPNHASN